MKSIKSITKGICLISLLATPALYAGSDHDTPHAHEKKEAGPNGGRVITSVTPHVEFLLTSERKVKITFLDDEYTIVSLSTQHISLIGGNRSNPTQLSFTQEGQVFISDKSLPEGNNLPIILTIQPDEESESVIEKFNLNTSDCPSCDYQEYACICGHN